VALVSDAGTPTVSDPGQHLVRLAHAGGIRVEPVPGPSAIVAALSASGFPSDAFVFLGFPPTKQGERAAWFDRARAAAGVAPTLVFYEAPHRIEATLQELRDRLGNLEVLLARELTKAHEEVRFSTVSALLPLQATRGEYTVVVNIGDMTNIAPIDPASAGASVRIEFGEMTATGGFTRRQAIAALSRKHRMSAREVYALLERAKNSVG
jgi:16S rRNA (cytidine1402-2'-O)-methyltransferase